MKAIPPGSGAPAAPATPSVTNVPAPLPTAADPAPTHDSAGLGQPAAAAAEPGIPLVVIAAESGPAEGALGVEGPVPSPTGHAPLRFPAAPQTDDAAAP